MKMIFLVVLVLSFSLSALSQSRPPQPPNGRYQPELLRVVLEKIKAASTQGQHPVVIFDLDDTLINSRTRTLRILHDLSMSAGFRQGFPQVAQSLVRATGGSLSPQELERFFSNRGYHIRSFELPDIVAELGVNAGPALDTISQFWLKEFFSNDYCGRDIPMPGAVSYANAAARAGAKLIYLTGRDIPNMQKCTVVSLKGNGFPGPQSGAVLMMKPTKEMDDTVFKKQALTNIGNLGTVVAGFENEPANVNAFQQAFPQGTYGFVDDVHSKKPDVPNPGIFWIQDFLPRQVQ